MWLLNARKTFNTKIFKSHFCIFPETQSINTLFRSFIKIFDMPLYVNSLHFCPHTIFHKVIPIPLIRLQLQSPRHTWIDQLLVQTSFKRGSATFRRVGNIQRIISQDRGEEGARIFQRVVVFSWAAYVFMQHWKKKPWFFIYGS